MSEKIDHSLPERREAKKFRCSVEGCAEQPVVSVPLYQMKEERLVGPAVPVLYCRKHRPFGF